MFSPEFARKLFLIRNRASMSPPPPQSIKHFFMQYEHFYNNVILKFQLLQIEQILLQISFFFLFGTQSYQGDVPEAQSDEYDSN